MSDGAVVSGLLVTPGPSGDLAAIAASIAGVPGCAVERAVAGRLVVVAESSGADGGHAVVERLQALPGVGSVDVVFVAVEPPGATARPLTQGE